MDITIDAFDGFLQMAIMIVPVILLATWAFWSKYPVAYQILWGVSLIVAFSWYDEFGTDSALAFSLGMILFSILMAFTAIYLMLTPKKEGTQ